MLSLGHRMVLYRVPPAFLNVACLKPTFLIFCRPEQQYQELLRSMVTAQILPLDFSLKESPSFYLFICLFVSSLSF